MIEEMEQGRARVEHGREAEPPILAELRRGLQATPPRLPSKLFYDRVGSSLFERITQLEAYYPTAVEAALLRQRAVEVLRACQGPIDDVVELGSGSALKTIPLLELIAAQRAASPRYIAVDISRAALERTRRNLERRIQMEVRGLLADYGHALPLPPRRGRGTRLVLFLGGTLGNEENESAVRLLTHVREHLEPGDSLLLGVSTVAEPRVIEAAYNPTLKKFGAERQSPTAISRG
jgi:L-histidine N-alpha-methyltransferase